MKDLKESLILGKIDETLMLDMSKDISRILWYIYIYIQHVIFNIIDKVFFNINFNKICVDKFLTYYLQYK